MRMQILLDLHLPFGGAPMSVARVTRVQCFVVQAERKYKNKKPIDKSIGFPETWCPEEDSNLHASRH